MLGETQDQSTYLRSRDSEGRIRFTKNNKKHAEMNMLHYYEMYELKLPTTIWLSHSPCDECAIQLEAAYRKENPKCPTYPTIKIAAVYTGKGYTDKNLFNSPHVQHLVALHQRGFKFERWDLNEDYKKLVNPKKISMQELMAKYRASNQLLKTGRRLILIAGKCRELVKRETPLKFHNPFTFANMKQIPILYKNQAGKMVRCCTIFLTACSDGVNDRVKPLMVFRGTEKQKTEQEMVRDSCFSRAWY